MPAARRIRLELDPAAARAVHSAVSAALAAELVAPGDSGLARDVLSRLDRRVPDWLGSGDDPEAAIDQVLAVLATAEDGGRPALGPDELATALGTGGRSLTGLLERMSRERLVRRSEHDGREWIAIAAGGRRRLGARRAAREAAPVSDPEQLVDVLYAEHRPGRWAAGPGSASSGEPVAHWRIPPPPRPEWLIYLQAHTPAGTPAYADGSQADHNRPRWRRAR